MTLEFVSWTELADMANSDDWEVPEILFPGRRPKLGQPHWLVVEEDPEDGFTVEHTEDCIDQYGEVDCDVMWHQLDVDLDPFFHRADVGPDGWERTDGLLVGRYLIEAYSTHYESYWSGDEYDSGLQLIYPEEAM